MNTFKVSALCALVAVLTFGCSEKPTLTEKTTEPIVVAAAGGKVKIQFVCCDDGLFCNGVETCANRDCFAGTPPCTAEETCDETADTCIGSPPPTPECITNAECDDTLFCNGSEICVNNTCNTGAVPCATGETCDETSDTCVAPPECTVNANCDDGAFCNGAETCIGGSCTSGTNPCATGETCDETTDACVVPPECVTNAECDDTLFCNGNETCVGGSCTSGTNPCATGETCDETSDTCIVPPECTVSSDCDDGAFCNGAETCVNGNCTSGTNPCATGETCDETSDACVAAPPAPSGFEGFGNVSVGGAGGEVYHVTSLANSGAGTLRDGIRNRNSSGGNTVPRTIVFDVGGTITFQSDVSLNSSFLTIDGSTAPSPGITIRKASATVGQLLISSGQAGVHDLIFTHLRFIGNWNDQTSGENNAATFVMDGEDHPDGVYNIVLDHIVSKHGTDSAPDMWGNVHDVTISWSMFFNSQHPMTISHSGTVMARQNMSLHHNVFARNHERSPQIRGNVHDFDYVNNVVYNWGTLGGGGYGVRITDRNGAKPTLLNFINNYFLSNSRPDAALVYGPNPGPGDDAQGVGQIFVSGNIFPPENVDEASTMTSPVPIPASAQVTTFTANQLATLMLPHVGVMHRDAEEQSLIDAIIVDMGGTPVPACTTNANCDDGAFCNGSETCSNGICIAGTDPCGATEVCDEATDTCSVAPPECVVNADCDDVFFCNGSETCVGGNCTSGTNPCAAGESCNESTDTCSVAPVPDFELAGLPIVLVTAPPQNATATLTLNNIPANTTDIELTLSAYDPDFVDEGRLLINGQLAVTLFGTGANNQHDSKVVPFTYTTGIGLYQLGVNTFEFFHDNTGGYRIDAIAVKFIIGTPACTADADCTDGLFCNGVEQCFSGICMAGTVPCQAGEVCDETTDSCVIPPPECVVNADCDDGFFCNGSETCVGGSCNAGTNPCPGQLCKEATDTCEDIVGWQPPIGVPMPTFGINESHMMYAGLPGYQDNGDGPYTHYIDSSVACNNSNNGGRGSPTAPLCNFPGGLQPGDVVEIHGGIGGNTYATWTGAGSQAQPIFIRGASATNRGHVLNRNITFNGQYLIVENLDFDTSEVNIGGHHISFRHNEVHNRDTGSAVANAGGDDNVFYNNEIHHAGFGSSRGDRNGFYAGSGSERVWVVDNYFHHNKGDSIAFCHNCSTPYPRWIYIGRNLFHEDEENAINIKYGDDVIITENTMYGYTPSIDSNGDAIRIDDEGIQSNIWILYNDISNSVWGIATYNGISFPPHIVGNRIYDCQIGINGDANSLINNLIYNVAQGINNARSVMKGSNNIISNVSDYHLHLGTFAVMDNTLFHQPGGVLDIRWGGNSGFSTYTTAAAFESATGKCDNCLEGDPLLVFDSSGKAIDVAAGSPTIDAGNSATNVYDLYMQLYGVDIKVDQKGVSRPQGAAFDIGTFEK